MREWEFSLAAYTFTIATVFRIKDLQVVAPLVISHLFQLVAIDLWRRSTSAGSQAICNLLLIGYFYSI